MNKILTQYELASAITAYMAFRGYSIDRDIVIKQGKDGITVHLKEVYPANIDKVMMVKMIEEGEI